MTRAAIAVVAAALVTSGIALATPAHAGAVDCGPLAKGEIYVVSGRDAPCPWARGVMMAYIDGTLAPGITCGGESRFPGAWCTSPPDVRIELR
jgi:hypothetical protein